jgi:hypothetical protein
MTDLSYLFLSSTPNNGAIYFPLPKMLPADSASLVTPTSSNSWTPLRRMAQYTS